MPIISPIGRRDPRVRLLQEGIFVLLLAGGLTMLYPFLLMIAGSTKSAVDAREMKIVPSFLVDDTALYRKHIEGLFNERLDGARCAYDQDPTSFETLQPPAVVRPRFVAAWSAYLAATNWPDAAFTVGYVEAPVSKTMPGTLRAFKRAMIARYHGDIAALNRDLGTEFVNWTAFFVTSPPTLSRRGAVGDLPFARAFESFKRGLPPEDRVYMLVDGFYKALFLRAQYSRHIEVYNQAHGTAYASYDDVRLTRRVPDGTPAERTDWETFVRESLNLDWIRLDEAATPAFRAYLQARYRDLAALNLRYGTAYADWSEVKVYGSPPPAGVAASDWASFIAGWVNPDDGRLHRAEVGQLRLDNPVFGFQDALRQRYGTVAAMNGALGTRFADFDAVRPPQQEAHYLAFLAQRGELRKEFALRNYLTVLDFLVVHGRGLGNTVIYCLLAIGAALLINPLAAYAMSRYRMPNAYKILLFLLMTMAFPPMVTQIPNFLLLRQLSLLNTFAALILPALANGYAIFLLKGFFDSLPRELYESAAIDGASEWVMFWNITMSLSKPILAVTALGAFNAAYANFMFALLICQDEKMWTLMVWLYQLQGRSGPGVIYASLLLAALPTFVVFALCQKVIMRGIVVPVEK